MESNTKLSDTLCAASDATGFDQGDRFASADEVRAYMTVASQRIMFDGDAITDQSQLDEWADEIIETGYHMAAA